MQVFGHLIEFWVEIFLRSNLTILLYTAIYECESTGGSQWIREDIIHLKNIELQAEMPPMDLSVFNDVSIPKLFAFSAQIC